MTPRTGRPLKADQPRNERLFIRLTTDELKLLKSLSEKLGKTQTDVIVEALVLYSETVNK